MVWTREVFHPTEVAVEKGIAEVLRARKDIVFLSISSQNIDRIVSAYRACVRTGTIFVVDLYTAFILYCLGKISKHLPQFNSNNIRIKYYKKQADDLADAGYKDLLYKFNSSKIEMGEIVRDRKKILLLARDNSIFPIIVKHLKDVRGTTFIYSMWGGYLKESFKDKCRELGVTIRHIHTSGHAPLADLQRFADAVDAKHLIPVHTFEPSEFPRYFKNVKILQDEEIFSL